MRIRLHNILALAPVFGGFATYIVYRIFFTEAGINGIGNDLGAFDLERPVTHLYVGVDPILGLLSWGVTGTFFVLSFLGGMVVLMHVLYGALRERSGKKPLMGFAICVGAAVAIGLLSFAGNPLAVNSLNGVLVESFELHGIEGATVLLGIYMPMVLAVTVLLMASAWATVSKRSTRCTMASSKGAAVVIVALAGLAARYVLRRF